MGEDPRRVTMKGVSWFSKFSIHSDLDFDGKIGFFIVDLVYTYKTGIQNSNNKILI
jgi:hypothetical protein